MNRLTAFLRLIRIGNILIMLLTMMLAYYCLSGYLLPSDLLHKKFLYLVLATLLTAAGGYIINDYYDVKLDLVNKPGKVIVGNVIPRRWAMLLHVWFNIVAIGLGLLISPRVAFAVFACGASLLLYSVYFKKQFLSGNLLIAAMSAFVIFILRLFDRDMPLQPVLVYSIFAFSITVIREIIKDTEDVKGDRQFDCKTLPIVIGMRRTRQVLLWLTSAMIVLVFCSIFIASGSFPFPHDYSRMGYIFYMVLCVIVPLGIITWLLAIADVKKDFSRLSLLTKLVMLTGMLSMIWLRM